MRKASALEWKLAFAMRVFYRSADSPRGIWNDSEYVHAGTLQAATETKTGSGLGGHNLYAIELQHTKHLTVKDDDLANDVWAFDIYNQTGTWPLWFERTPTMAKLGYPPYDDWWWMMAEHLERNGLPVRQIDHIDLIAYTNKWEDRGQLSYMIRPGAISRVSWVAKWGIVDPAGNEIRPSEIWDKNGEAGWVWFDQPVEVSRPW